MARADLVALIIQLPPCLIGMEACSGAHHRARLFRRHGHTVRLMAPKFVTPCRMSGTRQNLAAPELFSLRHPHKLFNPSRPTRSRRIAPTNSSR